MFRVDDLEFVKVCVAEADPRYTAETCPSENWTQENTACMWHAVWWATNGASPEWVLCGSAENNQRQDKQLNYAPFAIFLGDRMAIRHTERCCCLIGNHKCSYDCFDGILCQFLLDEANIAKMKITRLVAFDDVPLHCHRAIEKHSNILCRWEAGGIICSPVTISLCFWNSGDFFHCGWIMIKSDFFSFSLRKLQVIHTLTPSMESSIFTTAESAFWTLKDGYSWLSSAKWWYCIDMTFISCSRPAIYSENNNGPRTLPCGTPHCLCHIRTSDTKCVVV